MRNDITITVGCEYGTGGPAIGKKIAEDYGIPCYDRSVIDRIIEETGFSHSLAEAAESGAEIRGRRIAGERSEAAAYSVLTDRIVYIQTQIIKKLADRGPCVFVGRCADFVLKDRENVLNVFVYAPEEYRLANIRKTLDISEEAARWQMEKNDRQLHARYKQMTGTYRGDRHNRHMLIDSSILGTDETAKFIESFAEKMFPE